MWLVLKKKVLWNIDGCSISVWSFEPQEPEQLTYLGHKTGVDQENRMIFQYFSPIPIVKRETWICWVTGISGISRWNDWRFFRELEGQPWWNAMLVFSKVESDFRKFQGLLMLTFFFFGGGGELSLPIHFWYKIISHGIMGMWFWKWSNDCQGSRPKHLQVQFFFSSKCKDGISDYCSVSEVWRWKETERIQKSER